MKLIIAIVQDEDASRLVNQLMKAGIGVTKLATTGGFLRAGNTTLLIGVDDAKLQGTLDIIEKVCKSRKQMAASPTPMGGAEQCLHVFPDGSDGWRCDSVRPDSRSVYETLRERQMAAQTGNAAPVLSDFEGQGAVYDGLMRTLHDGTFVHAYLITGLEGMGKRTLARAAGAVLALSGAGGGETSLAVVCRACQQVRDGTHADLVIIAPGKPISPDVRPDMKSIPVDEIRALIAITARHTFEGGRRVVLIEQADKMNPPAQNALLKTLEEPVPGTIFLLMTESPSLLLPTIVSRCRELKLHPWDDRTVLSVLEKHGVTGQRAQEALHVSGGSIGKALAVAGDEQYWQRRSEVMRDFFALERRSDILRISSTWKDRKDDAEELLDDVEDMLRTLLLCHLGQRSESAVTPYPAAWQRFSREGELSAMMRLLDAVAQARQMRANQVTWQAVVERLLLSLMEEKSKWST